MGTWRPWLVGILVMAMTVAGAIAAGQSDKVQVEMYSESLCPFCSRFIVNILSKFFTNGLIEIVDLTIIPYGNAKVDSEGQFQCQHGPDECKLNIIQTCAIKLWPRVTRWFPFIYCLESLPRDIAAQSWKTCKSAGLDVTKIEQCYSSSMGFEIEMAFAKKTDELNPPHKYVPWVLVNGKPLYEDYGNVVKYVCEAYRGSKPLPSVCSAPAQSRSLYTLKDLWF